MAEKRYLICPDFVTSKNDYRQHWIGERDLRWLYGVPRNKCEVAPYTPHKLTRHKPLGYEEPDDLIPLRPRWAGDYAEHLAKMEAKWDLEEEEEEDDDDDDDVRWTWDYLRPVNPLAVEELIRANLLGEMTRQMDLGVLNVYNNQLANGRHFYGIHNEDDYRIS